MMSLARTASVRFSTHLVRYNNTKVVPPLASIRTESFSSFSPVEWWRQRQLQKGEDKARERLQYMASQEKWTLADMLKELDEVEKSWLAKVPGISDNQETKMAKQMLIGMKGLADTVGHDATIDRIETMTRPEKLQAAIKGEISVEDMNLLIKQFYGMDMMHRVLRQRNLDGKPIPDSVEALKTLMMAESAKLMTRSQKNVLAKQQGRTLTRSTRRR